MNEPSAAASPGAVPSASDYGTTKLEVRLREIEENMKALELEKEQIGEALRSSTKVTPGDHMVRPQRQLPQLNAELDQSIRKDPLQDSFVTCAKQMQTEPAREQTNENNKILTRDHIERYSRQLLLAEGFGVAGQCQLLFSSSVLVIGAGGIASSLLQYLAAFGVGRIAVMDHDRVEVSNLHRQVIHTVETVGVNKAVSACQAMRAINPYDVECIPIQEALVYSNALEHISKYDCIVDASDNPQTRYLVNDACVLAGKPLVSGSAVGTEGQLTVYNYDNGPCYRCLYPKPSIAATASCQSCSDAGVLGPVPGLIGVLQAMEVVKILTGIGRSMQDRLLMYDALECSFLTVGKGKLKRKDCPVCSGGLDKIDQYNATSTKVEMTSGGIDSERSQGQKDGMIRSMEDSQLNLLQVRGPSGLSVAENRKVGLPLCLTRGEDGDATMVHVASNQISCQDYKAICDRKIPHVLLDVRVQRQYEMCALPGAVNIPLYQLPDRLAEIKKLCKQGELPVYCVCRRGVASAEATQILAGQAKQLGLGLVADLVGGLRAWQELIDETFPKY